MEIQLKAYVKFFFGIINIILVLINTVFIFMILTIGKVIVYLFLLIHRGSIPKESVLITVMVLLISAIIGIIIDILMLNVYFSYNPIKVKVINNRVIFYSIYTKYETELHLCIGNKKKYFMDTYTSYSVKAKVNGKFRRFYFNNGNFINLEDLFEQLVIEEN